MTDYSKKQQVQELQTKNTLMYNDLLYKNRKLAQLERDKLLSQGAVNTQGPDISGYLRILNSISIDSEQEKKDAVLIKKENNSLRLLLQTEKIKSTVLLRLLNQNTNTSEEIINENFDIILNAILNDHPFLNQINDEIEEKINALIPEASSLGHQTLNNMEANATRNALKEVLITNQGHIELISYLKKTWAPVDEKEKSLKPLVQEKIKEAFTKYGDAWFDTVITKLIQKHLETSNPYDVPDVKFLNNKETKIKEEIKKTRKNKP